MKRLAIAAAAAFVVLTGAAYAQTTTRIGTEGAYAPWNFVNADGKLAGFDIDVGNELCKRAGLQCEFIQTAWDTIIPNLNAGNFDIIMAGMSITDERKAAIDFTADYSPPETSSFLSAAATAFDYNALKGIKIGTQGGTIQAAYADANLKDGNTLVSFETADAALADLSAGNVDVVLADNSTNQETVASSGGALKVDGPQIPIGGGVGAGVRKADTELKTKLDTALAEAKADGTIDKLIVQWFPERGPGPYYKK
ncbi:MAG TPA: transporter substrate-binding domain-containing protein [Devosia sp.]|nr:transporter substrate-binding domain-containing protein [Devosia sp.]